jgi:hypothetical protein
MIQPWTLRLILVCGDDSGESSASTCDTPLGSFELRGRAPQVHVKMHDKCWAARDYEPKLVPGKS